MMYKLHGIFWKGNTSSGAEERRRQGFPPSLGLKRVSMEMEGRGGARNQVCKRWWVEEPLHV